MTKKLKIFYKLIVPKPRKCRVKVDISEVALLKMVLLTTSFRSEVGWHGVAKKKSGTSFTIEDILVYPQDAYELSVDTEQCLYEQWLYSQPNEVFNNIRMHGHSHYKFGISPSVKDDLHREKIVEQLVNDMFYIFMIWNRELKIHILIYDREKKCLYDYSNIDLSVTLDGKSIPIKNVRLEDIKEKLETEEMNNFLNNAKSLVVNERAEESEDSSKIIRDVELYSLLAKHTGQCMLVMETNKPERHIILADEDGTVILRVSDDERSISLVWSIDDVRSFRPDLTDDELMAVLERVKSRHDMEMGVSWTTVEIHADELYPKPEDAEMFGKYIRNEIAAYIADEYDTNQASNECKSTVTINGKEVKCRIVLKREIDKKRLYHHWYGGYVVRITVTVNGKKASGEIEANGDIKAHLCNENSTIIGNIKDKTNNAGFYELSQYISDDTLLDTLLAHENNEQGLSLQVEDSNWWELFPYVKDNSSVVLDDYALPDAIGKAAAIFYKQLLSEGNGYEPE